MQRPPPRGRSRRRGAPKAAGAVGRNNTVHEKQSHPERASRPRKRAEVIIGGRAARVPEDTSSESPETVRQLVHDLRVHQIELEMQNDELRRAQQELEASRARYFDLYDMA